MYVEGRLRTRSWDTPDGQRHYRTEVVADRVLFLDRAGGTPFPEDREGEQNWSPKTSHSSRFDLIGTRT